MKDKEIDAFLKETTRVCDAFLKEIIRVCKEHDFSISHEDAYGGFIIKRYDEENIRWLLEASRKVNET